ncbi:MAG: sugar ABC transporter ATP-binding protein, partial [Calditrichia bacterium]|nr:sugar ABC transporter ATP-binding protein [Calditrichia bacterium]
ENIFLGRETTIKFGVIDQKNINESSQKILNNLGVKIDASSLVKDLGVAQQQMVEVAKALSIKSNILIMDEPTSALTNNEIQVLFKTIRKIKKKGVGIIYISHRMEELFDIGDRITVLRDGRNVGASPVSDISKAEIIKLMANRELKEFYPRVKSSFNENVLTVNNLNSGDLLRDISFYLKRGEILGISGLLGAGRTELARALFGADPISSGSILINGGKVVINSPGKAIKSGIGLLTEDRKQQGLVLQLSVKDNIGLPNLDIFSYSGFLKKAEEKKAANRLVRELRIKTPSINQKVLYLSGGNQQKVVLSKWLSRHLDVLIFDEPTRGIDVASKVEIYQIMNELTARGVGIIMISSELPEILGMSDRILVMHGGRITAEFEAGTASQEELLAKALGDVA